MPTERDYMKAAYEARQRGDEEAVAYFRSKYVKDEKIDPTEGMSGFEKFRAGMGSGMVDAGRNVTNMVTSIPGLKKFRPDWASDEAINEQRRTDEALMDTGAGLAGNIVGGAVATAPIGGAAAKGVQLAGRGVQAARALPRAAQAAGRVAGGRATPIVAQGAVEGAILGGPDNRMMGAGVGAVGAGMMHGAGRLSKAAINRRAKAIPPDRGMSEPAKFLTGRDSIDPRSASQQLRPAGMDVGHIPASHSLPENSVWKQIYSNVVANMPGSTKTMHGQLKAAQHLTREEMIGSAIPAGVPRGSVIDVGDNIQGTMGRLADVWDTAFDDVKGMVYAVHDDFNISSGVKKLLNKEFGSAVPIPEPGDVMDGGALIKLRNSLKEIRYGDKKLATKVKDAIDRAADHVDQIIKDNLDPNDLVAKGAKKLPDGPQIYKEYLHNIDAYRNYRIIYDAAKKAVESEFSFADVAKLAKTRAGREGVAGRGGFLQETGEAAAKVLGKFPNNPNPYQTLAAYALGSMALGGVSGGYLGGGQGAALGALATPFAIVGGSRALASPAVQRRLLGTGRKAKPISKRLKKALEAKEKRTGLTRGQFYGFGGRQLGVAATTPEEY